MFESIYNKSLDEETFESWLEKGRSSRVGYQYLLVIWNNLEQDYQPIFLSDRDEIYMYAESGGISESLVAAYDIYSESRITLGDNQ